MTSRFGIDTSVLVRLLTGEPREDFLDCVAGLIALVEQEGSEIFASNQVIGEAYVAVQHHYRVSKLDARTGLLDVLRSGPGSRTSDTSLDPGSMVISRTSPVRGRMGPLSVLPPPVKANADRSGSQELEPEAAVG